MIISVKFESNILVKVDKIHPVLIYDLFTQTGSLYILVQQKLERMSPLPLEMSVLEKG